MSIVKHTWNFCLIVTGNFINTNHRVALRLAAALTLQLLRFDFLPSDSMNANVWSCQTCPLCTCPLCISHLCNRGASKACDTLTNRGSTAASCAQQQIHTCLLAVAFHAAMSVCAEPQTQLRQQCAQLRTQTKPGHLLLSNMLCCHSHIGVQRYA